MSNAKVVVTGIPEIDRRLRELGAKLANKIGRDALRAEMKDVKSDVVANTPEDSGALKRSTRLQAGKRSRSRISVEVVMYDGTGDDGDFIAAFQEFGTATTPAVGMMRRAYDENRERVREGIIDRVRDGIEREA